MSINKFKNLLKHTKIMEKMLCFRACEELVNQIYNGHVIAVLINELDVDSIHSLAVAVRKCNINTVIEFAYKNILELELVNTL